MVRNIVGSLVYVGTDARSPEWMREVLEARDRSVAAPTFYASGLYLTGVEYPEKFGLPSGGISPFGAETTEGAV
jgi:tRNA pseudouridine38-40 synthase